MFRKTFKTVPLWRICTSAQAFLYFDSPPHHLKQRSSYLILTQGGANRRWQNVSGLAKRMSDNQAWRLPSRHFRQNTCVVIMLRHWIGFCRTISDYTRVIVAWLLTIRGDAFTLVASLHHYRLPQCQIRDIVWLPFSLGFDISEIPLYLMSVNRKLRKSSSELRLQNLPRGRLLRVTDA